MHCVNVNVAHAGGRPSSALDVTRNTCPSETRLNTSPWDSSSEHVTVYVLATPAASATRASAEVSRTMEAEKARPVAHVSVQPPSPSGMLLRTTWTHGTRMRSYRRLIAFSKGLDAP